jgi:hypothetical protein
MKKTFRLILATITLAATACVHEFPVTDHTFEFNGNVVYDQEADQHRLTLTCVKNSGADQYNVAFSMDSENVITLTDMEGRTYQDSFKESFTDSDSHTYILSETAVGSHLLQLVITTDEFSQSIDIPYEVTRQKYDIHAEVSTVGAKNSTLMMSLADGDTKYTYSVAVSIDGEELFSEDIDFDKTPIASIDLPDTIRPHEHTLTLSVNDSMTDKEYTLKFTEPVRHPNLDIKLEHDSKSGYHVAIIGNNPYSVRVDFSVFLELKGKSSFYHEEEDFWWRRPEYKYITETDEHTLSEAGSDCLVNLTDRDGIAKKITSQWETSYIWSSHSTPGGGEDSGEDYSYISGSTPAFYQICREDLSIDISGEKVSGVTLKITNQIGTMTLNGKSNSSGTTNISL